VLLRCRPPRWDPIRRACFISPTMALVSRGAESPGHTLMRYPTLYGNTVVFAAHDNLWSVPRSGGAATRLTADEGRDVMPWFSPDGRWIAFTGEYQGNRDVYVIPSAGGAAKRLTFNSDIAAEAPLRCVPNNMVVTWTPDCIQPHFPRLPHLEALRRGPGAGYRHLRLSDPAAQTRHRLSAWQDPAGLIIRVTDSGIGIEPAVIEV
jgi:WD40-like Beta Propeller Repeat